mgnify:FL=1
MDAQAVNTMQFSSPPASHKVLKAVEGQGHSPEAPCSRNLATELCAARTPSTALHMNRGCSDFQGQFQLIDPDRDSHAAFLKVFRSIASFRHQVQAAADGRLSDPFVHQVLSLVEMMEHEVKVTLAGAGFLADGTSTARTPPNAQVMLPPVALSGGTSPERSSYESMRQAMQDMQRRCENLLARIHKESEANLELSKARAGAEETSRKLSEQVNQQTEELNRLVRQRLNAEEQLEDVRNKSRIEAELREEDFQRKLAAAHKEADDRCDALQKGLVNKLHLTQRAMEKVKCDFDRLRADHADSRKAVLILNEAMSQLMGQTERSISQRIEELVKISIEHRVSSTDTNRELELRILAEQELRFSEVGSLSQRCSTLQRERDQLQASFTNDVARLSVQLEEDKRKMEEWDVLRSEAEAKQQASDALTKDQAEELKQCKVAIDQMKCMSREQTDLVSSHEQELQRCKDVIQQLKSDTSDQSAVVQRQQQELDGLRLEIAEKQAVARRLAEERDSLRVSEAKEASLSSERAEELQRSRDTVEQLKVKNKEQISWVSSQEEELQRCKDVIQQLKSDTSDQSAVVQRQQQELDGLRLEIAEKQAVARRLAEEREQFRSEADQLLATEAMQLVMISQRAEELQKCRDDVDRLKSEGMEQSALVSRQAQEMRQQKAEIEQLRRDVSQKEAAAARFQEAKGDLVLTENRRQHLLEQRRSSSKGLNALHTQLESHILRLQKHSDELRGELGQAGPC